MSAAHTPGPWTFTLDKRVGHAVIEAKGRVNIATAWSGHTCSLQSVNANAKLIAAAPQLAEDVARLSQALREIAMLPPSRAHEAAGIAGRALKKGTALTAAGVTP